MKTATLIANVIDAATNIAAEAAKEGANPQLASELLLTSLTALETVANHAAKVELAYARAKAYIGANP